MSNSSSSSSSPLYQLTLAGAADSTSTSAPFYTTAAAFITAYQAAYAKTGVTSVMISSLAAATEINVESYTGVFGLITLMSVLTPAKIASDAAKAAALAVTNAAKQ
jgi:hypothetical protein